MSGRAIISFFLIGFLLAQCCSAKSIFKATEEASLIEDTENSISSDQEKSSEKPVSFEQVDPPEETVTTEQNETVTTEQNETMTTTEQEETTEEAVSSEKDESTDGKVLHEINESAEETTSPAEEESNTTDFKQEESSEQSENVTESEEEKLREEESPENEEEQNPSSDVTETIQLTAAYYIPNVTETLSQGQKILKSLINELEPASRENLEAWFYRDGLASYDRKITQLRIAIRKANSEDVNLAIKILDRLGKFSFPDEDASERSESDILIREAIKETDLDAEMAKYDLIVKQFFYDFDYKFQEYWDSLTPEQKELQEFTYDLYQLLQREEDFIEKLRIFKILHTI